jgi:hypothetical protein
MDVRAALNVFRPLEVAQPTLIVPMVFASTADAWLTLELADHAVDSLLKPGGADPASLANIHPIFRTLGVRVLLTLPRARHAHCCFARLINR